MGKIVISSSITLDGVVQDPDGAEGFERGGWFREFVGGRDLEDWVARETEELLAVDALLLGGRSSEWFASRMPTAGERVSREWADRMMSLPKYIVSSRREAHLWSNATVIEGDVVDEISRLKRDVDGEILVYGSYGLVRVLIDHDLADELRLVVFPVVLGAGQRIFDETAGKKPLHLVGSRRLGEGLLFDSYEFQKN